MKKVLVIIPDGNKERFISKGFAYAFRKLGFFVCEKKFYDLDINEINKFNPDIIFIFWSNSHNKVNIENFTEKIIVKTDFIHCSEYLNEIPQKFHKLKSHYIFAPDAKNAKFKYIQPIFASDYKVRFERYKYNITFSGNPAYNNREIILSQLIKNFGTINIFCRSYDFYKSVDEILEKKLLDDYQIELYRKSYKGYVDSSKELANIYTSTKVNIDIQNEREKELNYRVLEITASGGFVIAPYTDFIIKQYDNEKDVETYKNTYELIDKTDFYLKNTGLGQMIALRGKKNTISNFSYYDKLKEMLKVIYGKNFSSR